MPDSVRTRYERRLIAIRNQLPQERHPHPLGAILVSLGAITDNPLNRAPATQRASSAHRLPGEVLLDLECIGRETLTHALSIQHSATTIKSTSPPSQQPRRLQ